MPLLLGPGASAGSFMAVLPGAVPSRRPCLTVRDLE